MLTEEIAQGFLAALLARPEIRRLLSAERFSVDDMMKAFASLKSAPPKDGSGEPSEGGSNGGRDFNSEKRSNATHAFTTDPDARLYRKAHGQESRLAYLGRAFMENRNGLAVGARVTCATGTAAREADLALCDRAPWGFRPLARLIRNAQNPVNKNFILFQINGLTFCQRVG